MLQISEMTAKEREKVCKEIIPIITKTGKFLIDELFKVKKSDIEVKSENSLVSYVDKKAEEMLVAEFSKILPNAGYLTEEGTVEQGNNNTLWIIDPLDGTSNYLHKIPHFAVSVALSIDNDLQIGVVYSPCNDELFYAWKDGGAYLNGEPIQCNSTENLSNAIVATGFPYSVDDVAPLMRTMGHFMRYGRGIRRFGAAALDLAYVACGRFDVYYEAAVNAWDLAGGAIILTEAGGKWTDFKGNAGHFEEGNMIASNKNLHSEVISVIQDKFRLN